MKNNDEMINLGNGSFISKELYKKALEKYYQEKNINGIAPLTYNGKVIGHVSELYNDTEKMKIENITEEGKEIINKILHNNIQIGISARKMGNVLEDGTVDCSQPFTKFEILRNIPNKANIDMLK